MRIFSLEMAELKEGILLSGDSEEMFIAWMRAAIRIFC